VEQGEFVDAPLTRPVLRWRHAPRRVDGRPANPANDWELRLCFRAEETSLMAGYIVSGAVALVVIIYLFIALLFPERF
jgi:K+-transporting ATPase KdpF subunit